MKMERHFPHAFRPSGTFRERSAASGSIAKESGRDDAAAVGISVFCLWSSSMSGLQCLSESSYTV